MRLSELLTQGPTDPGPQQSTAGIVNSLRACQSVTKTLGVFYHQSLSAKEPHLGGSGRCFPVSARLGLSCQPHAHSQPLFNNRQKSLQGRHSQQALGLLRCQGACFPGHTVHSRTHRTVIYLHRGPSHQLLPPATCAPNTYQASCPCQALA